MTTQIPLVGSWSTNCTNPQIAANKEPSPTESVYNKTITNEGMSSSSSSRYSVRNTDPIAINKPAIVVDNAEVYDISHEAPVYIEEEASEPSFFEKLLGIAPREVVAKKIEVIELKPSTIGFTPSTTTTNAKIRQARENGIPTVAAETLSLCTGIGVKIFNESSPEALAIAVIEQLDQMGELDTNRILPGIDILKEIANRKNDGLFSFQKSNAPIAKGFILTIGEKDYFLYLDKKLKVNLEEEDDDDMSAQFIQKKRPLERDSEEINLELKSKALKTVLSITNETLDGARVHLDTLIDNFQSTYKNHDRRIHSSSPPSQAEEATYLTTMNALIEKIQEELVKPELAELKTVYDTSFKTGF